MYLFSAGSPERNPAELFIWEDDIHAEPGIKRAYAFIDGQGLFHGALEAFGYGYPNFGPKLLAGRVCSDQGWVLEEVFFYTGVPDIKDNPYWHRFWNNKLIAMRNKGISTFSRTLRYQENKVTLPDGRCLKFRAGREKGIDIRIALDIVRAARQNLYDVALVFSQDQDLSEVADEIRAIAKLQGRWIKIASAFPYSPTLKNKRGINGTDWIRIVKVTYDACIDPHDYRPKKNHGNIK
jgi:uncharacterized LabA/DUF88 family protein